AALLMLGYAAKNFVDISIVSILHVVNDVLFVLIIAEVLWTIIRYLRREEFSLAPFLFIGIISSVRRILFIDAEMSMGTSEQSFNENIIELGIHVTIVFILVVAYYLVRRARAIGS
ncbi:MAG: phosphate-starvation-inducible PsiE family protein, partial [Actinomycetota bacterium]